MKARDFIYWLQGGFEIGKIKTIDEDTVKIIQNHIEMVFIEEIDPSFGPDKQEALQNAHDGNKPATPPRFGTRGGRDVVYKC